jgi:PAS domain S-box-containing protein
MVAPETHRQSSLEERMPRRATTARGRSRTTSPDFRTLFERAPGLFLVLQPDLTIVAVSDAYLEATMTRREEIVGRALFEVFPANPDDPAATGVSNLRASLDRVRSSLVPDTMAVQKYDIRRPDEDGGGFEERYWSPVNTPIVGSDGKLSYIVHRVEDVTEFVRLKHLGTAQQQLAEQLQSRTAEVEAEVYRRAQEISATNRQLQRAILDLGRSQSFLDSVIENIPAMVFVKDAANLRFVRQNRAGEELLGHSRSAMIGKTDYDFFPPEEAEFFTSKDREVLEAGRVVDIPEEPIDTVTGRRYLHTRKIPIFDEEGKPVYLLGISEDITERKEAADALQAAREEAERANRAKTEFLSRMSHELRTPLNAILGFAQLLELEPLPDDQREHVDYILSAGRHLLDLINEILDISRIESGQMSLSAEPVEISEVIDEVVALISPQADARRVTVATGSAACDQYVMADRQRLKQVLLNLTSNAVKYNRSEGSVTIACDASQDRMRISVTDTGHGIAPEYLERLFRPFDRLGAEIGTVEGTGMGLALSKGLIEAMGGAIGVDTRLDTGSTFWIELDMAEGPIEAYERLHPSRIDAASVPEKESRLILQIEDNASNLRLVERIVRRQSGLRIIGTGTGRSGIDLARKRRPDLVLLDLHLPDITGHEVLRQLQTYPETRKTPVVVLSADATRAQIGRLIDGGAFGYVTKPIDVAIFLETVSRALDGAGEGSSTVRSA